MTHFSLATHLGIKDDQYFTILKKMADGNYVERRIFESKLVRSEYRARDPEIETSVSHSSLFDRWNELLDINAIFEVKTSVKNKKGDYIKVGQITFLGVIKLLSLSHGKYLPDIFQSIRSYFPFVSDYWENLKSIYSEKQLFNTLTSVCKNISIDVYFDLKNIPDLFPIPSSLLSNKIKWLHLYHVEVKIPQLDVTYTITRPIFLKGNRKNRKVIRKETYKAFRIIRRMLICAFFHELLMRGSRLDDEFDKYPGASRLIVVFDIIKGNKILSEMYKDFLKEIEQKYNVEIDRIKEIRNSIH